MTMIADPLIVDYGMVRTVLALAMFVSASYFDLRKREVSDLLWIPFAAAAGILYLLDFPATYEKGILIVVSLGITAGIAFGIYRSGLFGGADMLGLITFSAIMPLFDGSVLLGQELAFHKFAPIILLTNAIIFSLAHLIFNVARNLAYNSGHSGTLFEGLEHESTSRKIFAMVVGHRSNNPRFAFPIEKMEHGKREFDFSLRDAETAEYETRKDVWVTSGIPYLIYFTAGFVMMILVGDILAVIFGWILPSSGL
jgi:preflagellin peptidase FlaK